MHQLCATGLVGTQTVLRQTQVDSDYAYIRRNQSCLKSDINQGGRQKLPSGFFPLRGYPPPSPTLLAENYFAKKTLAERGGTTPPPLTENCRTYSSKMGKKGLK